MNPRAASGGAHGEDVPPLFPRPETFLNTVPVNSRRL